MSNLILDFLKEESITKEFYKTNNTLNCSNINNEALLISAAFLASRKPIFIIKNSLYSAKMLHERVNSLLGNKDCYLYPCDETFRLDSISHSKEFEAERVYVISKILENKPIIVIAHSASLIRLLPKKEHFVKSLINLKVNDVINKDELISNLLNSGYERVSHIDHTLQFASRGGVVDVFSCNYENPLRIEFFDDEIESIRLFDIKTSRTLKVINEATILPAHELVIDSKTYFYNLNILKNRFEELKLTNFSFKNEIIDKLSYEMQALENRLNSVIIYKYFAFLANNNYSSIIDYLSCDYRLVISNEDELLDNYKLYLQDELDYKEETINSYAKLLNIKLSLDLLNILSTHHFLKLDKFNGSLKINTRDVNSSNGNSINFKSNILDYYNRNIKVVLCLDNAMQKDFVVNIFKDIDEELHLVDLNNPVLHKFNYLEMNLKEGFELVDHKVVFFSASEIFGGYSSSNLTLKRFKSAQVLKNVDSLKPGDYIVHETYGIGLYRGVETKEVEGIRRDYLSVLYQDDVKVFIPLEQFSLVRKYISREGVVPKLSKIGTDGWNKTKNKIRNRVNDVAEKLIELYSLRVKKEGFAFEFDDEVMNEFFLDFPYELTIDQKQAYEDIKKDMESNYPMDRLLCGDVGFGKTEVAFRAAFAAIMNNKQVALLCPTTLLSRQHYKVALERFQNFNINIALVNRFIPLNEQKQIINDLKEGKIDLLIGTHRLLSSDFNFKDLGLLIIDEEHRFGVEHKEKIKEFKSLIDVLTLSATPIPRTLQMSLVGIRNLSQIQSAPSNRQPVQTHVIGHDFKVIKEIIQRELAREGQVFYLFNKTDSLALVAREIEKSIPGAKVVYAHGKMDRDLIEETMIKFYNKEANVLVCTTIIENGIDIPMANTVIIANANRFGLSQLYQIKGRVGRGDRLGYAYLTYDPNADLSDLSKKRLQTIKDFTELGSGYRVAMRDLAIRGAGDILGSEQSGFIDTVGIEMYLQILKEAIDEKKSGIIKEKPEVKKTMYLDTYIPTSYEENDIDKINIYQQIDKINDLQALYNYSKELEDNYGKTPNSINLILEKRRLEILSKILFVEDLIDSKTSISFSLNNKISSIENFGIYLFETTYKLSRNFKLSFIGGKINISLSKKEANWLEILNNFLIEIKNKLEIE